MKRLFAKPQPTDHTPSESELELFGGPLRYDTGWATHEYARLQLTLLGALRSLPQMVHGTLRLALRADRRALTTVGVAEVGQGITTAIGLVMVNQVLQALLGTGTTTQRLHAALPALVIGAVVAVCGTVLASASTAAAGRLEPKVERAANELYLEGAARAELEAIEDGDFRRLIDIAQYGANAARRMIGASTAAINAVISLIAAGSVLTALTRRRAAIDPVTVLWEAQQRSLLEAGHDPKDLLGLLAEPVGSPEHWGERILQRSILTTAHHIARRIEAFTNDPATTPYQLITGSRRTLADLSAVRARWHHATSTAPTTTTPVRSTALPCAHPPQTTASHAAPLVR